MSPTSPALVHVCFVGRGLCRKREDMLLRAGCRRHSEKNRRVVSVRHPRAPTVWGAENDDRVDRTLFSYDRVRVRQARPVFYSLSKCSTRLLITCSYLVLTQQRLGTPENYFACMHARHVATAHIAPLRSAPASRTGALPPKTAYDLSGRRHVRTPRTLRATRTSMHFYVVLILGRSSAAAPTSMPVRSPFSCVIVQMSLTPLPKPWHARCR